MKKRILSFVVAIALVVGMLPMAAFAAETTTFPDMPDNWATEALQNAVANGLLQGIDGNIAPDANLTRAQMATIVTRAFGTNGQASLTSFTDVESGAWYYDSLAAAVKMGAFKGDGASMNPNANITRQEAFTVLSRLFALSDGDVTKLDAYADKANVADWAKGPMAAMVAAGYVSGADGMLNPQANITRAEFAVVMNNLLKLYVKADTTASAIGGNAILNAAGTMKDFTINGDLIIGDGVAEGDAVLDNVSVTGRVVVRGGGVNSVKFINGTSAEKVVVVKVTGDTRITTDGNTTLANVVVSGESEKVIVTGNVTALTLEANAEAALDSAKVETVTVAGANASLTAGTGTTVNTVNVAEAATGAAVTADKNATIKDVTSSADNVTLAGEGTIEKATVSGDNTKVNTTGTSLTVDKDATGVTQNNQDVAGGSTVTTKPETGTVTPPSGGGSDDEAGSAVVADVITAPLVNDPADGPDEPLDVNYKVEGSRVGNKVSLKMTTTDPIPLHYNAAHMLGYWAGFGIPVDAVDENTKVAAGFGAVPSELNFSQIDAVKDGVVTADEKNYYTFYYDISDATRYDNKIYLVLKTGTGETEKTITYTVDLSSAKIDFELAEAQAANIAGVKDGESVVEKATTGYEVAFDKSTNDVTINVTGPLEKFMNASGNSNGCWLGVLINTSVNLKAVQYRIGESGSWTSLTDADIDEATAAMGGTKNNKTLVYWVTAEEYLKSDAWNTLQLKANGSDNIITVKFNLNTNPVEFTSSIDSLITETTSGLAVKNLGGLTEENGFSVDTNDGDLVYKSARFNYNYNEKSQITTAYIPLRITVKTQNVETDDNAKVTAGTVSIGDKEIKTTWYVINGTMVEDDGLYVENATTDNAEMILNVPYAYLEGEMSADTTLDQWQLISMENQYSMIYIEYAGGTFAFLTVQY